MGTAGANPEIAFELSSMTIITLGYRKSESKNKLSSGLRRDLLPRWHLSWRFAASGQAT